MKYLLLTTLLCISAIEIKSQEKPQPPQVTKIDPNCEVEILDLDFYYDYFNYTDSTFEGSGCQLKAVCKNIYAIVFERIGWDKVPFYMYYSIEPHESNYDYLRERVTVRGDTVGINLWYDIGGDMWWDWDEKYRVWFRSKGGGALSDWVCTSDYVTDPEVRKACEEYNSGINDVVADDRKMPKIEGGMLYPNGKRVCICSTDGSVLLTASGTETLPISGLRSGLYLIKYDNCKTLKIIIR